MACGMDFGCPKKKDFDQFCLLAKWAYIEKQGHFQALMSFLLGKFMKQIVFNWKRNVCWRQIANT